MKKLGNYYKCYYKKLFLNTITYSNEIQDRAIIIFAKNKDIAIKCCEFEVGVKPYKIKKVLYGR